MAVVLITGCRSGFGFETALAFARRGDRVYATMRDPERGDRLREVVAAEGLAIIITGLDVTKGEEVASVISRVIADEGRIDVLVNNAGVPGTVAAVEEMEEAAARHAFETNFWGPFRLSQAVLPHMRHARSGIIVNISSIGARLPAGPAMSIYGITKHALSRLTEAIQAEVSSFGVRVVAIEPGFFATDIYDTAKRPDIDQTSPYAAIVAAIDSRISAGVSGGADPADVARAIIAAVDDPTTPTCVLVGVDAIAGVKALRDAQFKTWSAERAAS